MKKIKLIFMSLMKHKNYKKYYNNKLLNIIIKEYNNDNMWIKPYSYIIEKNKTVDVIKFKYENDEYYILFPLEELNLNEELIDETITIRELLKYENENLITYLFSSNIYFNSQINTCVYDEKLLNIIHYLISDYIKNNNIKVFNIKKNSEIGKYNIFYKNIFQDLNYMFFETDNKMLFIKKEYLYEWFRNEEND